MMLKLPASAGMRGRRHARQQAVEAGEQAALPERLGPVAPHGIDDVVAGDPFGHQAADRLGRVLQVGIHQHDRIAPRVAQTGLDGGLMPEVARQVDDADVDVALGQTVENLRGGVGRAVVDENDFLARATGEPPRGERGRATLRARWLRCRPAARR